MGEPRGQGVGLRGSQGVKKNHKSPCPHAGGPSTEAVRAASEGVRHIVSCKTKDGGREEHVGGSP